MTSSGVYVVENANESSTDPNASPTDTRGPHWSREVGNDFLNYPDKEDNTRISVIGYNQPPRNSFRSRNGRPQVQMTNSEKRNIAVRGALFALILVSVLVAIAAIIALAIVLTDIDREPSTTPRPQTYDIVQYSGQFRLQEEWSPELANQTSDEYLAMEARIITQMDKAFMSSVLWRYYNRTEIISLQNGSIITAFNTFFSALREYTPLDPDKPTNISVPGSMVGAIIVDQFLSGVLGLALDKESVIIQNVTTTTTSTTTTTTSTISSTTKEMSSTTPMSSTTKEMTPTMTTTAVVTEELSTPLTTTEQTGLCHRLEISECKGVNNYNFTVLPRQNQTELRVTFLEQLGSFLNSTCSAKAWPFFCSSTFRKCDPETGIEVWPCRHLCQEVSRDCALDIPCAALPQAPAACYDGGLSPETTPALTTPQMTSPATPTTTASGLCHTLQISDCRDVYNDTILPRQNQTMLNDLFLGRYGSFLNSTCSMKARQFFCAVTFRKCDRETGSEVWPCQHLCQAVSRDCAIDLPCANLPQAPATCFDGGMSWETTPTLTTPEETTPTSPMTTVSSSCHSVEFSMCQDLYSYTTIPSANQGQTAIRFLANFGDYLSSNCSLMARPFFCAIMFRKCDPVTGSVVSPCRQLCQRVSQECLIDVACADLPLAPGACFDGGMNLETTPPTTQVTSPPTPTTAVSDVCHNVEFSECQGLYRYTTLPSLNQTELAPRFQAFFGDVLSSNCSLKALQFFCASMFTICDPKNGSVVSPCRQLCEEVSNDCSLQLPCANFPQSSDSCYNGDSMPQTTALPPRSTPDYGFCEEVPVAECKSHYNTTVFFTGQNKTAMVERFGEYNLNLDSGCSAMASLFLCANSFPKCEPKEGLPIFPCQDLCSAFMNGCSTRFNLAYQCSKYPPAGGACISLKGPLSSTPATTTTTMEVTTVPISTTKAVYTCQPVPAGACNGILPYTFTSFPNEFGHESAESASTALLELVDGNSECPLVDRELLICPILFPKCEAFRQIPPCRPVCEALSVTCIMFLGLDCQVFPSDDDPKVCVTSGVVDTWVNSSDAQSCSGFHCSNGKCLLENNKVCDGSNDCGDNTDEIFCGEESAADCSFEDGTLCNYVQDSNDNLDWSIQTGAPPSMFTGPRHDNTYRNQSGHYLYLEATGVLPGNQARLTLPERSWQEHCLRVAYHMRGQGMGTLKVLTEQAQSQASTLHWVVDGHLGNMWKMTAITLPRGDYSIILEGRRGSEYTSDMAIDDITSRSGPCPAVNSSCGTDQFSCHSTNLCVPMSKRCDTVNNCGDFSDEMDCECTDRQYYFQCNYGNCIKAYMQCDNNTDCPDGSDEENCVCPRGQAQCPDGKCIMSEWLCDGDWDCRDGWDEDNCLTCKLDEHTCQDYTCVPQSQVCDGEYNCADRSDEEYCVRRRSWDNMLEVRHGLSWLPVCYTDWLEGLGYEICDMTGDGPYNGTVRLNYASTSYLKLENSNATSWMKSLNRSTGCEDAAVVGVKCEARGCGTRTVGFANTYIVGGNKSPGGRWPWMASFTFRGTHECGGTLIAPQFVLTAAHCIQRYVTVPFLLKVVLGGTAWGSSQPSRKQLAVEKVIPHPDFVAFSGNDIGLIQLQAPVDYDPYISPACMPQGEGFFPTSSLCFVAGWGQLRPGGGIVELLREAKIKLWQTSKCNSSLAWNGSLSSSDFCAGYISGAIGTCHGDSGGPLMCRDQTKRWKLVGISSYVTGDCTKPGYPPVFTDVRKQLDWINSHIECQFRCDNGRCLYDNSLVCNREDDCGDNSDETRTCLKTLNCTFDSPFLCGYELGVWFPSSGMGRVSPYPTHDHTQGTYPGIYLASNGQGGLKSPTFTLNITHCVRFYYNFITSEMLTGDFTVSVDSFSSSDEPVRSTKFRAPNMSDTELWRMGQFELTPGKYQVIFQGYRSQVVSIDDVLALPGECAAQECLSGEFRCAQSGCITEAEACNLAVHCAVSPDDEFVCADRKPYNCTFENNLECGISRLFQTNGNRWILTNGTNNYNVKADHTLGTAKGQFLYSSAGVSSSFGLLLILPGPQYCVQFSYQVFSKLAQLTLDARWSLPGQSEVNSQRLLTAAGRRNATWNRVVAPVPLAPYLALRFTFSVPPMEQVETTFAAVDDISIKLGECPAFDCPTGTQKCQKENFCITPSQVCDHKVDCNDLSDENNCTCGETEFRCDNGLCIASSLTCNGVEDCLDGSDESNVCDALRTVNCDFEDAFICGYKITSVSQYSWFRESGSTKSSRTGPSADNTYKNFTGHYVYTEASFGNRGDTTELTSIRFSANLSDNLVFYYHMRGADIGELAVLSASGAMGSPKRIWDRSGDQGNEWKFACVPLPSGPHVQVSFLATNTGGVYGDVAIDDIAVTKTPCPATPTTTTPGFAPTATSSPCPPGHRPCSNGLCLQENMFCNNIPDCPDGDDELDCVNA